MFKTKASRNLLWSFSLGVFLDLFLAYVLAGFAAGNEFWLIFVVCLAVFWLGPLLFTLKSTLYRTTAHFLFRSEIRKNLVHEFRKAGLPLLSGTDFNDPADLYFAEVAADDSLPKSARLFAAQTIGQLALVPTYSVADSFTMNSNLDAALAQYFDEMRRDGVKPHGLS